MKRLITVPLWATWIGFLVTVGLLYRVAHSPAVVVGVVVVALVGLVLAVVGAFSR